MTAVTGVRHDGAGGTGGWLRRLAASLAGRGGTRGERQLELLETLHLGPKRQLLLVRCGGESFLVGAGTDGVTAMLKLEGGSVEHAPGEPR